jgi:hypothetical protein
MSFLLKPECITGRAGSGDVLTLLSPVILPPGNRCVSPRPGMSLSKHHTRQRKTVPIAAGLAMPVLPHANVAH